MKIPYIAISILSAVQMAAARSFSDEISTNPQLSNMSFYVSGNPNLRSMFDDATNATILAPENSAFNLLVGSLTGNASTSQPLDNSTGVAGILLYHIVNGTWQASDFSSSTPQFLPTYLDIPNFANVSGGQAVQFLNADGSTNYTSGLNAGGQFINSVSNQALFSLSPTAGHGVLN